MPACTHVVIARVTIFHLLVVFIVLDVVEKHDDFLLLLHRRSVYRLSMYLRYRLWRYIKISDKVVIEFRTSLFAVSFYYFFVFHDTLFIEIQDIRMVKS